MWFSGWVEITTSVQLSPELLEVIDVIADQAATSDVSGVPRSHFHALARVGAHGSPKDARTWREITIRIAGADTSTWFCWAQHQTPLRTLELGGNQPAASALQERWLPGLQSGEQLAAVAFGHLRRPGPANPVARQLDGAWVLDGTLDWVTSWDIADLLMIMAFTEDKSQIVTFFIPIDGFEQIISGTTVGEPLQLLAMSGTHTRPIKLTGSVIPAEFVFDISPYEDWRGPDTRKTNSPNFAAFGIARAAIEELESVGIARNNAPARELAAIFASKYQSLREHAENLVDSGAAASDSDLIDSRVEILEFARECAIAVVVARAGAGMQSGRSAERRVREAMFLQIQAQTEVTRNAALHRTVDRYAGLSLNV